MNVFSPNTVIASAKVNQNFAEAIAGNIPISGIIPYWSDGGSAPDNYVFCDGSVINNTGSTLNGRTTPDLTNRFVRGTANSNLRTTPISGGEDTHTLTVAEMPSHTHVQDAHNHDVNLDSSGAGTGNSIDANRGIGNGSVFGGDIVNRIATNQYTGGDGAHNNIPVYIGMVYIMRII